MTRKDTILIAVIVNACLLAVLFLTAFIYDAEDFSEKVPLGVTSIPILEKAPIPIPLTSSPLAINIKNDEIKDVLKPIQETLSSSEETPRIIAIQTNSSEEELPTEINSFVDKDAAIDVTVKKGDSLDKIARAHGTTVSAIKQLNQLQTDRLSLGQVLKVSSKKEMSSPIIQVAASVKPVEKKPVQMQASDAAGYYVVKPGDSPWKIAKQNNISVEEILKLNQLDEDKARSLKVGDRIRVK